ncbi:MAG TPA: homoserine O-acetyltransferase [Egibacteraceae bacterium]|nr:homoserine O-acetyltransferase [Egibacteraceae bacterium]
MNDRRPPPASGAWRPGDLPGDRRFLRVFSDRALTLEAGGELGDITVAYETWGTLAPDHRNAVLVCHALTGDSHVAGPAGGGHPTPGWWDGLVGPGKAIDTDRWFVVCPNVLGGCQGTTGPASEGPDGRPWGSRWPRTTVRDQVAVEAVVADALHISRWAAVVGGSMGGMRVLEWAVGHPDRVDSAVVLAAGAAASAEQIALQSTQVRAIRLDPRFRGGDYYDAAPGDGPHEGIGLARRIGHLTYRTEREVEARFGREPQGTESPLAGGRYQVESYLDHHADKLARRFDANSYIALSEAMSHHDVGRGRGGVAEALARVQARVWVIGIDADRLYPVYLQRRIASLVPTCEEVTVISSPYGHDGFLIETEALTPPFRRALAGVSCSTS